MADNYDLDPKEEIRHAFDGVAHVRVPKTYGRGRVLTRDGQERGYSVSEGHKWDKLAKTLNQRFGQNPSDEEPTIPISVVTDGTPAVAAYLYVVYGLTEAEIADLLDIKETTVSMYHSMVLRDYR